MSSEQYVIRAQGLGKCYHIYNNPKDRLKQAIIPAGLSLMGRPARNYYREFWALRSFTFDVKPGETVGIIGRNGSGKSTLLQMICGTLMPTVGAVETKGRVAALLELGAGFNPEFTGRENVYMNGAILGFSQSHMEARFEQIAEFADIGEFIDQPVKCYSSGMYARLAFAVAIHVEPDILIVDEALAVGDEPFQRKCFAKIDQIKSSGGSILFVSHSTHAIVDLCDRAVLLHQGETLYCGSPKRATGFYQKLNNASADKVQQVLAEIADLAKKDLASEEAFLEMPRRPECADRATETAADYDSTLVSTSTVVYESKGAIIENPRIVDQGGRIVNMLVSGDRYRILYDVVFTEAFDNIRFRTLLKSVTGVELGGGTYPEVKGEDLSVSSGSRLSISLEFACRLGAGVYFVNCGVASGFDSIHRMIDALVFRVVSTPNSFSFGMIDFAFDARARIADVSSVERV